MEPITASIVIILGKYVIDKGIELGKEVGPKALEAAQDLATKVLEKLKEKKPALEQEYTEDPKTFEKPVEKFLETEFKNDQSFELTIKQLLDLYNERLSEYQQVTNLTHNINHVQGSTVVTGNQNIVVGGSMTGNIHVNKDGSDTPA